VIPRFCFLVLLTCGTVWPSPPMRIPLKVTGSFGEYRDEHLHAGLDLSTYASTGHEVLAIEEGWLYRVKQKPSGEGRTIYLRHRNSRISVYAHLEDFSSRIQAILPNTRIFDMFPDSRIPFKEGEVIGYSGESGRGLPHLHLEVRSSMTRAKSHSMYIDGVKDQVAPTISSILLVPFMRDTQRVRLRVDKKPHKIKVSHPVGVAVEAFDLFDESDAPCHIPEFRLYRSRKLIYHVKMAELSHLRDYASAMHYLRDSTNLGPTVFTYKLYRDYVQKSPFILTPSTTAALGAGSHQLRLEAEDFHGNISSFEFELEVERGEVPNLEAYSGSHFLRKGNFSLHFPKGKLSSAASPRIEPINPASLRVPGAVEGFILSPSYLFWTERAKVEYTGETGGKEYFLFWNAVESRFEPTRREKKSNLLSARISQPGKYLVARDFKPPRIEKEIQTLKAKRKTFYYISATDTGSGIDPGSVHSSCGQNSLEGEWDIDRKWVRWQRIPCPKITLALCDYVGNCTQEELNVKGAKRR